MGLVSIIIVTYNSENEIRDCINSILNSSRITNFEILIADNHSTDETVLIIENFDSSKITLIKNNANLGYTKANNQCLKLAKGEYFLLLNPDTILQKNTLNILTDELRKDDILGAVASQLKYPDGKIQKSCRRFPRRRDIIYESLRLGIILKNSAEFNYWKMGDFSHEYDSPVEQPAGAAILLKRSVVDKIGLLDEQFPMFFSDVDFCRRIMDNGNSIKFISTTYITHLGGSSILRNRMRMIISSHSSFYKYFKKYRTSSIDSFLNFLTGILLVILIPVRVLINSIFPKAIYTNRKTL